MVMDAWRSQGKGCFSGECTRFERGFSYMDQGFWELIAAFDTVYIPCIRTPTRSGPHIYSIIL